MGSSTYSYSDRSSRAKSSGYYDKPASDVFTQSKKREIHESMDPKKITLRECRDSEAHPFTVPIVLTLDVTGSMHDIPKDLIKDGLPSMMSSMIQNGVKDASLLFLAVGDHECDKAPLQVGQFESGDSELDLWLTRTWLEGGGGANAGESYLLSWYFAANYIEMDSFEKRGEKGILFTIGDEPCLTNLPKSAINEIFSSADQSSYSDVELIEMVQKKFNVFHLHVNHGGYSSDKILEQWKKLLGQNCVEVKKYTDIPKIVSDIVISNTKSQAVNHNSEPYIVKIENTAHESTSPEIML